MPTELHDRADRLLQGLQGLVLHLHAISSDLPVDAPTRVALELWLLSAEALVSQGCAEGPQRQVGAVAHLLGLLALGRRQQPLHRPLRLRVQVGQTPWDLQPDVQQAVVQLACDHVRTACDAAGATRVTVQLFGDVQAWSLRVRDNGRWNGPLARSARQGAGQVAAATRSAATRLGARLRIWHWPGGGGELQLQLPAQRAYDHAARGGARPGARPGIVPGAVDQGA